MIAVDVSVLAWAVNRYAPEHRRAAGVLEDLVNSAKPWALPWPVVHEFMRLVTHPHFVARPLRAGMALAWNPSLPWAKSEDTFLLGGDGVADADLTNLTWDPRWPHVLVAGRPRAAVRVL